MIVMKFGGTSVGVPEHFAVAQGLVVARRADDPVVVVSALAGVTNLLVDFCRDPADRRVRVERFERRHVEVADAVGVDSACVEDLLAEWRGVTAAHTRSRRSLQGEARDALLSFGERLSAAIFAAGLAARGLPARAVTAGEAGLVTDDRFGAAHPLPEAAAMLRKGLASRPPLPVVTGFLGRTEDGRVTTLGRGGSDYSAALIGGALGAGEIQIWTDTSG